MPDLTIGRPLLIGLVAGVVAQSLKVFSFLIIEKRINFRRFVETDGAPNMHSAAFAALGWAVGQTDGFGSIEFALVSCVTALVTVDMWNVKHATSRQAQVVGVIVRRVRPAAVIPERRTVSYSVLDVLTGTVLGIATALLLG